MTKNTRMAVIAFISFGMVWITISVVQSLATRYSIFDCLGSIHMADCR